MSIGDNIALLHEGRLAWEGNKDEVLTAKNEILQGFVFASPFLQRVRDLHD
jgi:phospholipid/cholesterol/gamma-HCH transport system ATP-binding protein